MEQHPQEQEQQWLQSLCFRPQKRPNNQGQQKQRQPPALLLQLLLFCLISCQGLDVAAAAAGVAEAVTVPPIRIAFVTTTRTTPRQQQQQRTRQQEEQNQEPYLLTELQEQRINNPFLSVPRKRSLSTSSLWLSSRFSDDNNRNENSNNKIENNNNIDEKRSRIRKIKRNHGTVATNAGGGGGWSNVTSSSLGDIMSSTTNLQALGTIASATSITISDISVSEQRTQNYSSSYSFPVAKMEQQLPQPTTTKRIRRSACSSLGDIMCSIRTDGLVTGRQQEQQQTQQDNTSVRPPPSVSSSSSLAARFGIHHPLDRMALTANGNLQRLVSSYYDAPVSVVVRLSQPRRRRQTQQQQQQFNSEINGDDTEGEVFIPPLWKVLYRDSGGEVDLGSYFLEEDKLDATSAAAAAATTNTALIYDRVVDLQVYNTTFCTATSVIVVRDPVCQQLVQSGTVGLGQLFRFLDVLPEFTLLNAGVCSSSKEEPTATISSSSSSSFPSDSNGGGGNFWRDYRLDCDEFTCRIHETFCPGMWNLSLSLVDQGNDDVAK